MRALVLRGAQRQWGFKHGIGLSNGVGVIDSDYRGEISVGLVNLSGEDYTIRPGDRIAQLMVVPVVRPELVQVDALDETGRAQAASAYREVRPWQGSCWPRFPPAARLLADRHPGFHRAGASGRGGGIPRG